MKRPGGGRDEDTERAGHHERGVLKVKAVHLGRWVVETSSCGDAGGPQEPQTLMQLLTDGTNTGPFLQVPMNPLLATFLPPSILPGNPPTALPA